MGSPETQDASNYAILENHLWVDTAFKKTNQVRRLPMRLADLGFFVSVTSEPRGLLNHVNELHFMGRTLKVSSIGLEAWLLCELGEVGAVTIIFHTFFRYIQILN